MNAHICSLSGSGDSCGTAALGCAFFYSDKCFPKPWIVFRPGNKAFGEPDCHARFSPYISSQLWLCVPSKTGRRSGQSMLPELTYCSAPTLRSGVCDEAVAWKKL